MKKFQILYITLCKANIDSYFKDSVFVLNANDENDARRKFYFMHSSLNGLFIKQVLEVKECSKDE